MKNKTYSEDIANAICSFFEESGVNYYLDEQRGVILFDMSLNEKLKKIHCKIRIDEDCYTVYGYSPINVDEDDDRMMTEMAHFIACANYNMVRCHFDLDERDGEILAKSFVPCEGIVPTERMVALSIGGVRAAFELYGDGIVDIIFGDVAKVKAAKERADANLEKLKMLIRKRRMERENEEIASESSVDTEGTTADGSHAVDEIKPELFGLKGGNA